MNIPIANNNSITYSHSIAMSIPRCIASQSIKVGRNSLGILTLFLYLVLFLSFSLPSFLDSSSIGYENVSEFFLNLYDCISSPLGMWIWVTIIKSYHFHSIQTWETKNEQKGKKIR